MLHYLQPIVSDQYCVATLIDGNMQYMRSADGEGNEYGYEDEEEEGSGKRQYIDFNNLNGEQQ